MQQAASGATALLGFSLFSRTADSAWRHLSDDGRKEVPQWSTIGLGSRAAVVFALGTTAVALSEIMASGEVGVRRHLRAVFSSAILCATIVGTLAALVGLLAFLGQRVPGIENAVDLVLRVLGNPLLWLGMVALTLANEHRKRRRDQRSPEGTPSTSA